MVGRVEIYQIHGVLRNTDTTPFLWVECDSG